jgi:NADPH:quinone reductase-like Zn-dependent oxidoreductase
MARRRRWIWQKATDNGEVPMKVIGLMEFGGPEVLQVIDVPEPHAGPGQVRVRVHAAAVNPSDLGVRESGYRGMMADLPRPIVPGWDAAGVIDEIGPETDGRLAVGDQVLAVAFTGSPTKGAYQQQLIVPAASVVRAPANMDLYTASGLLMNALTARLGLDGMALKPGQTLAVTGSAGALGGYVIQLARADRLRVIADVSDNPADRELVKQLGADALVTRGPGFTDRMRALVPGGVDGLFDTALLNGAAVPAIADGGVLVTVRAWNEPVERGVRVFPVLVVTGITDTAKLERLRDQAESGVLTPRVAKVLPASQAAEAHRTLEKGGVRGRLVLDFTSL